MIKIRNIFLIGTFLGMNLLSGQKASAQEQPWTLAQCIRYARENNIQVQSARVSGASAAVDLSQAKAQIFPSLSFSTTQSLVNQKEQSENSSSNATYSGNYTLNTGVTLYNGGKLSNSVKQQEITVKSREYDTQTAQNDIEVAVTQAYLQILYANESLKTNRQTLENSAAQLARSKELQKAGSISVSDYAQIEAQYSSDKYQVTVAENALLQARLELKQLLELEIDNNFEVAFPELDDSEVLHIVPNLNTVYYTALEVMPQIGSGRLGIQSAAIGEKLAAADRLPAVSLNAGLGTGNYSKSGYSFYDQLNNKLNENISLSLSIPIFNNRKVRSAVEKARLQTRSAELEYTSVQKALLKTVESLHQDATSAQSRYLAATDKVKSASLSYRLVSEQFNAGMKNTVELLTEKNNLLAAQQEQIQAKYQAVLSLKLLNFYQNQPIEL